MSENTSTPDDPHVDAGHETTVRGFGVENLVEYAMLLAFVGITGGALVIADRYAYPADFFPKITSGIGLVSTLVILARKVRDDWGATARVQPVEINADELFVLGASLGYAVLGVLVGLLWVTPVFVFVYATWRNWSWIRSGVFALLSVGVPLFFTNYLAVDLSRGLVF